ncbi:MAG: hypothetical protein ACO1OB_09195 [Archangium sp.]
MALLAVTIFGQWAAIHDVFRSQPLLEPLSYHGDAQFYGAVIAAAKRGDYVPFASKELPGLGAPFVASWNDFPQNEDLFFFVIGLLAKVVGVFGAINLTYVAAAISAGLSLYAVARKLHIGRAGAFAAGQLYGLSGFMFSRSVHHLTLTFYFFIPWVVLLAMRLASRRGIDLKGARFRSALTTMVITGLSMVYLIFFAAEVIALAVATRWARFGFKSQWRTLVVLGVVVASGMVVMEADSILWWRRNGPNPVATTRNSNDVEVYALKPINFLTPAPGNKRFAWQRGLHDAMARQTHVPGEAPSPYLGVVGLVSFFGMIGFLLVSLARSKVTMQVMWAVMSLAMIILHSVGGLNSVMGLFGFVLFRSVNRASIVVLTYVLLFGAWAFGRLTKRLPSPARWAVAIPIAFLGVWEQSALIDWNETPRRLALVNSDRQLVADAERQLPRGAMVFSMPTVDFPESPSSGMDAYEMFRPYYFAEHLRFSHGDVKGRANAQWKFRVVNQPLPQMYAELRQNGFEAIYIVLRPYGGIGSLQKFTSTGATVIAVSPNQDSAFLRLP